MHCATPTLVLKLNLLYMYYTIIKMNKEVFILVSHQEGPRSLREVGKLQNIHNENLKSEFWGQLILKK